MDNVVHTKWMDKFSQYHGIWIFNEEGLIWLLEPKNLLLNNRIQEVCCFFKTASWSLEREVVPEKCSYKAGQIYILNFYKRKRYVHHCHESSSLRTLRFKALTRRSCESDQKVHWLHHRLMLCTLGLCIVNVHWCSNGNGTPLSGHVYFHTE